MQARIGLSQGVGVFGGRLAGQGVSIRHSHIPVRSWREWILILTFTRQRAGTDEYSRLGRYRSQFLEVEIMLKLSERFVIDLSLTT